MGSQLIHIGTVILNPAHVAYAEQVAGSVLVHMAIATPKVRPGMSESQPGHDVLSFGGAEAAQVWAALATHAA